MRAITDQSGTITNAYAYDSYGKAEESVESLSQRFRYTGREFDALTGLYHYRARAYDPETARFLQEDPLLFDALDLNVYRMTQNNPINFTDPTGKLATGYIARAAKSTVAGAAIGASSALGIGCSLKVLADIMELINPNMKEGRIIARECDAVRVATNGARDGALIVATAYIGGFITAVSHTSRLRTH